MAPQRPTSRRSRTEGGTDQQKAEALADRLENLVHQLLDEMSRPEKIQATSLIDLATALGIVVDRMLLLRGLPTSISGHAELSGERAARLGALQDPTEASRNAANGAHATGEE
jgi:hypothetical protein